MEKTVLIVLLVLLLVGAGFFLGNFNKNNKSADKIDNVTVKNEPNATVKKESSTNTENSSNPNIKNESPKTEGNQKNDIKVLSQGETVGFFEKIDRGDYAYFVIKDLNGKLQSFRVYRNFNRNIKIEAYETDPNIKIEAYETNPSYKGKKLKVKWQEIEAYIPEAGSTYKMTELLDLEELK